MRIIYTLALLAVVALLHLFDNPDLYQSGFNKGSELVETFWNEKKVKLEGLVVLRPGDIERLLPQSRSVLWWHLNEPEIQAQLMQNPWIQAVDVGSCDDGLLSKWGCFVLTIGERKPVFSAIVDGTQWIIDGDGSFVVPYGDQVARRYNMKLVSISGLASRVHSPDVVRGQLYSASKFMEVLQSTTKRAVISMTFDGQGDLEVNFQELPFPIIFGLGSDDGVPLAEQGKRCAALLEKVRGRYSEIEKIDLAFNRVGVVSFREP
jgi:hypothetical protein